MSKEIRTTKDNHLTQKDLEMIERLVYKGNDDVAVSIARSFERLEERIDAAESRIYSRLADIEDRLCSRSVELEDKLDIIKGEKHDTDKTSKK